MVFERVRELHSDWLVQGPPEPGVPDPKLRVFWVDDMVYVDPDKDIEVEAQKLLDEILTTDVPKTSPKKLARESAIAKLEALGLTKEEIASL